MEHYSPIISPSLIIDHRLSITSHHHETITTHHEQIHLPSLTIHHSQPLPSIIYDFHLWSPTVRLPELDSHVFTTALLPSSQRYAVLSRDTEDPHVPLRRRSQRWRGGWRTEQRRTARPAGEESNNGAVRWPHLWFGMGLSMVNDG